MRLSELNSSTGRWRPGGRYATPRRKPTGEAEGAAHKAVDEVKRALGERGPVWWDDGSPDFNRHMAKNTPYADWYAKLARSRHGGL
jgi:hypothetical protein